jgi:hypothetical protein
MADYRYVATKIWDDEWFYQLTPEEKVVWFYLLTNRRTSLSGIYLLPQRVISAETNLDINVVAGAMAKFHRDGKIMYEDGILWIVNMRRHQQNRSKTIQSCITRDVAKIPDCEIKRMYLESYGSPDYSATDDTDDDDQPRERTLLQMLDSIMPGRINESTRDWLNDVVAEHGEEAVRNAIIQARAAERLTNPRGYIIKILAAGRDKEREDSYDDWERKILMTGGQYENATSQHKC